MGIPHFQKTPVWQNNLPSFSGDPPPRFQNAPSKYASKSWTAHVSCRSKLSSAGWALLVQAIDVMPGTGD